MATKTTLQKVLKLAGQFVIDRKACWGHEEWDAFLADVAALGIALTDETKRNLGNILESCKCFYSEAEAATEKKAPAKRKAKAK